MWRHALLGALCSFARISQASSCWRDTVCDGHSGPAFPGDWDSYIYAPTSRNVEPKYVLSSDDLSSTAYNGSITLSGNGSLAYLDFGVEVGGITSLNYTIDGTGQLGLAYSESKSYIGMNSDDSNGGFTPDGHLSVSINSSGSSSYEVPLDKLRGGFRYLTIFLLTDDDATIEVTNISLEIGFQPTWSDLQAYQGYFYSSDDTLNKIWYSGAYTIQTNSVPVNTGRHIPAVANTWLNDGVLGNGSTIIVDGAKRDRAVWPGDMGVAVPSSFYSIGDLESVKNALQVMYNYQNADGSFPEAGPPLLQQGSDTYHMWTMIGTWNYIHYSNDTSFLAENWDGYKAAMEYIYGKVQPSGLLNVTGIRDWARWQQGFNNTEANVILYRTLITGSNLAELAGDTTGLSANYTARAADLQVAINEYLWDESYGLFKDNATDTTLYPQDANSLAVLFNVTTFEQAQNISEKLTDNWNDIGAVSPELAGEISPFISSFEIQAHFLAGEASRALDLIRRSWGWYLNHENGTQSTVIEGYLANGSFAYRYNRGYSNDPKYTSHSHGWSSGPTSALTNYVLGYVVTAVAGSEWSLMPQFGDLTHAEGGFSTTLGKFQASWTLSEGGQSYQVNVSAPAGTAGIVLLPTLNGTTEAKVSYDGSYAEVWAAKTVNNLVGFVKHVEGGNHTFEVTASE
ncbi:Six-hairpin glycosidase-like protein [Xylariales sp. PMI_506]|nr:Six-hairpin glycosidase-like protein [Xylariales sp. PMI_506]